jgi:hypothetical protein
MVPPPPSPGLLLDTRRGAGFGTSLGGGGVGPMPFVFGSSRGDSWAWSDEKVWNKKFLSQKKYYKEECSDVHGMTFPSLRRSEAELESESVLSRFTNVCDSEL